MAESQSVRCLVIPLSGGHWLIPGALVAEVVAFSEPQAAGGPDWFAGYVTWRGERLAVVQAEPLLGERGEPGADARLLVLKAITGELSRNYYALVSSGIPHLLNVTEETLAQGVGAAGELVTPVIAAGESMFLPQLDILEAHLAALAEVA